MAHQHVIQHKLVPKARLLEKEGQRDERLRWVQEQHASTDAINVARRLSTDIIVNTNREGRRNQHLMDYRIQSTVDVPISRPFSPSGEVSDDDTTLVPSSNQLSQQLTSSSPEHQDHEVIDSDSEEYYSASSQQGSVTEDDDAQITQSPLDADDGSAATAPASLLGPGPSDDMGGGDILAGEAVAARLTTGIAPVTDAGPIIGETVEISRGRLPTRRTATAAADAPEVPEVRRSARIQQARELNIRRNCKHRIVKKSTVEKAKGNKKASKKKK
ncbi:hypothetical protein BGZ97_013245 [Linnemannia gamsii]|uniref:Uncharacterized protein n=1 Tax=Linnemannia gamsii TaxID=64522 RepID=A0A9P6QZB3_9FUNG|nr:hypothetical protein BGZ97_013245 [Linnemannia gamsii]